MTAAQARSTRSRRSTARSTRPRSAACYRTASSSPATCGSRRASQADPALQLHRAHLRRTRRRVKVIGRLPGDAPLPQPRLGRPGQSLPPLAWPDHHRPRHPPAPGPPPQPARPAHTYPAAQPGRCQRITGECRSRRLTSTTKEPSPPSFALAWDAAQTLLLTGLPPFVPAAGTAGGIGPHRVAHPVRSFTRRSSRVVLNLGQVRGIHIDEG